MKTILVHCPDALGGRLFDPRVRDHCNDPYIALQERMRDLGYDLRTSDDYRVEDSEWILFIESASVYGHNLKQRLARRFQRPMSARHHRDLYRESVNAGLGQRMALLLLESPLIMPRNGDPDLHERFPTIFTWHDGYINKEKYHKLHIPQPTRFPKVAPQSFRCKKLLCNISANKYGSHPKELYGERRQSIRHFERAWPSDFDLYGVGWNQPASITQRLMRLPSSAYTSYRGAVTHKWDVYPRYRFALCYENVRDEPGYITEKIFDCMRADCVPVYWGASNIDSYVPTDAFVDRRQFSSNKDLESYLVSISELEYERYRSAIQAYLASNRFGLFLEDNFVERILHGLALHGHEERYTGRSCQMSQSGQGIEDIRGARSSTPAAPGHIWE